MDGKQCDPGQENLFTPDEQAIRELSKAVLAIQVGIQAIQVSYALRQKEKISDHPDSMLGLERRLYEAQTLCKQQEESIKACSSEEAKLREDLQLLEAERLQAIDLLLDIRRELADIMCRTSQGSKELSKIAGRVDGYLSSPRRTLHSKAGHELQSHDTLAQQKVRCSR